VKGFVTWRLNRFNTLDLRSWRGSRGTFLLRAAIGLMAIAALFWLGYQFWRLLGDPSPRGAIDLKQRYEEVQLWFSGKPVYGIPEMGTYPPATYTLLWPFLGWLTITQARWLWAATTILALGWFIRIAEGKPCTNRAGTYLHSSDSSINIRQRCNNREWTTDCASSALPGNGPASFCQRQRPLAI